jgi:hypothetical protein
MNPPVYCPRCDKEIPDKEEISSIRDLLKECGIFLKQGDAERAREALESLQYVCLFPLYEEECATVSRASQSEDNGLMTDIDKLFEGLVARAGEEAEGQASECRGEDECHSSIESIKSPAMGLVRLQLLDYQEHRVFEAPKSHNTADQIPPWGLDSWSVLGLLTYLDPYSEDQRTRRRLQCISDAISERWWRRRLPADSPLREMDAANIEKLMFAIKEKGNEVLYFEPPPAGPCWLLRRDASDKIDHRFLKYVKLILSDKTRRQAIGYLVAPMPARRLLEEGPFIRIVKMVLSLRHPEIASAKNPITDDVIRKAIRLIGLQNLKKISQIPKNAIREYCFTNPSSLAIDPGNVASFLGENPDMHLTRYDNEIRALLDEFDPEALAALWLQADSYIRNQIIDEFEKSDLRCAHCDRRLPNKEERRWVDLTREWIGQYGLEELYAPEKPFCLCPEKDLGRNGDERAQWRRKRKKLVAAVVLKYHKLDEDPTHAHNARFLLKTMTDLRNGKRLRDETDGTLKRHLRRFIEFGNEWLYNKKLHVPGHEEICVADMIDIPLFSDLLGPHSFDEHRGARGELLKMSRVLGQFLDPSQAEHLYNSQYPIPRKEYDPGEAVWRRMFDDDPTIDGLDAYDPELFALEAEMEAASAAEPGMSDSELRDKVYWEHPEHRRNPWLQLDWYKTCDALPIPGLLGIGGEPFAIGVSQSEFVDLRNYVRAVLAGNRFAHLYLDRYKHRGKTNV